MRETNSVIRLIPTAALKVGDVFRVLRRDSLGLDPSKKYAVPHSSLSDEGGVCIAYPLEIIASGTYHENYGDVENMGKTIIVSSICQVVLLFNHFGEIGRANIPMPGNVISDKLAHRRRPRRLWASNGDALFEGNSPIISYLAEQSLALIRGKAKTNCIFVLKEDYRNILKYGCKHDEQPSHR